jgi:hypothetical protein
MVKACWAAKQRPRLPDAREWSTTLALALTQSLVGLRPVAQAIHSKGGQNFPSYLAPVGGILARSDRSAASAPWPGIVAFAGVVVDYGLGPSDSSWDFARGEFWGTRSVRILVFRRFRGGEVEPELFAPLPGAQ